jgi:ComF family protein
MSIQILYRWVENIQSVIFPPTCLLCQAPGLHGRDICDACTASLPRIHYACTRCALPLPRSALTVCGRCQHKPPHFHSTIAPYYYDFPIDRVIQRLKFGGKLAVARLLGQLMDNAIRDSGIDLPAMIIPVPLHGTRLRDRGFNQSLELARHVGKRLGIPLNIQSVSRFKATPPQMGLAAKYRRKNIRGAFAVKGTIEAAHVALVDDVVTTGATVGELARVLKFNGVERVDVWAVARTT